MITLSSVAVSPRLSPRFAGIGDYCRRTTRLLKSLEDRARVYQRLAGVGDYWRAVGARTAFAADVYQRLAGVGDYWSHRAKIAECRATVVRKHLKETLARYGSNHI